MARQWQPLSPRAWLRLVWRGQERDTSLPPLSDRCSVLVGRAQLANVLAERAFRPSDALPFPGGDAVGCELAREATYWALSALREHALAGAQSPAADSPAAPALTALPTLWSETAPEVLDRAAEGSEPAQRVREDLDKSFADFAELGPEHQAATAKRLHAFAERLIAPLAVAQRAQERVWVARAQALLLVAVLLLGLGLVGKSIKARHDLTRDLAPSASWTASSLYPECACKSPAQSCEECPNFFFHTLEDAQPSVVFDLHSEQAVSAVVIDNRLDCCFERATPLVVQVSSDQKSWKTVAKHEGEFTTWRADFPSERARWVKIYVARKEFLHLSRVRILP